MPLENVGVKIYVDNQKTLLSGRTAVFKTERLISDANQLVSLDDFLYKTALEVIGKHKSGGINAGFFRIATSDKRHAFDFSFGQIEGTNAAGRSDIVFYNYEGAEASPRKNDGSLLPYLNSKGFEMVLQKCTPPLDSVDFLKLYRLSHSGDVHFPLLNAEQKRIVMTEDKHVLVQGVAGSGKTNVCIEKIIYCACKGYAGKVLYSTFSRGLLMDTQNRVRQYRRILERLITDYEQNRIVFLDDAHKQALENKAGVYFSENDNDKIFDKIRQIIKFLENKVDYFLLEDIYNRNIENTQTVVNEDYFVKHYVKNIKNHQLSGKLQKVSHLSFEVLYKEIYGTVLGCCDFNNDGAALTLDQYCQKRSGSLSRHECEIIFALAKDYQQHLAQNDMTDNNQICRRLLEQPLPSPMYSLAILDEVQDMTELNLYFLKQNSRKMFCVGDALQMINPSYFSFSYLKSLLYEKDLSFVAELHNHYRNTKKIASIIDELGKINTKQFGTHGFVLKGVGVDSHEQTNAVYVKSAEFISSLAREKMSHYTVIVPTQKEKEQLRQILTKQEILTVAEIKGLERETVVLYGILSSNKDKWAALERMPVNRKQADENSVYRYYFNLFYVGISRARKNIYVAEQANIPLFSSFLNGEFSPMASEEAVTHMLTSGDRLETEQSELFERAHRFIELEQYDNARFAAGQLQNEQERKQLLVKADVFESLVRPGKYREAGLRFWEEGMIEDARGQFSLSGDEMLCSLADAYLAGDDKNLNINILKLYPELSGNEIAKRLMLQVLEKDLDALRQKQSYINATLGKFKENK